jgi:sulfoxide reductase heme-binding subunit YedZ
MIESSAGKNWTVFALLTLLTAGCGAAWLTTVELIDENIRVAVRHTAQFAYAVFLIVIVVRPLQQLLRKPWAADLLRRRRLLGVAFAGIMTGHLMLIIFRFTYTPELTYPTASLFLGGSAYTLIYLMFITSFDGPTRALGQRRWKLLHGTGLIWAGLIFAAPRSLAEITEFDYLKLGIPMLIALLIRFLAWRQSKPQDN